MACNNVTHVTAKRGTERYPQSPGLSALLPRKHTMERYKSRPIKIQTWTVKPVPAFEALQQIGLFPWQLRLTPGLETDSGPDSREAG